MADCKKRDKRPSEDSDISPPPLKRKVPAPATARAVASFFTPTSQKPPERTSWREVDNSVLIAAHKPSHPAQPLQKKRRIAGFDLDGTVITTQSGKVFAREASDWKWWDPCVPAELRRLDEAGFQVIFFTNQGSVNLRPNSKAPKSENSRTNMFKSKATAILEQLDLSICVYAATERDQNRKPRMGMWEEMVRDFDLDEGEGPDIQGSFFVGDAAGRMQDGDAVGKDDFATSDRDFAANLGLPFFTPEEYFLHHEPRQFQRAFDPAVYLQQPPEEQKPFEFEKAASPEIVVLCGSPGVGKSTFYWKLLAPLGFERVNQDILKTRDKCLKRAAEALQENKSVAVDNTNADRPTRAVWIKLAGEFNVPIRCVQLEGDGKLCEHNDAVRALAGAAMNPESRSILPKVAFTGFTSRFQAPKAEEGFDAVVKIPFRFTGTGEEQAIWAQYWI